MFPGILRHADPYIGLTISALALLATGNVVPRDEATEARATVTREEIGRRYGAPRPEPEVARALDEAYAGYRSPDAIAEPALPPDADPRALSSARASTRSRRWSASARSTCCGGRNGTSTA